MVLKIIEPVLDVIESVDIRFTKVVHKTNIKS